MRQSLHCCCALQAKASAKSDVKGSGALSRKECQELLKGLMTWGLPSSVTPSDILSGAAAAASAPSSGTIPAAYNVNRISSMILANGAPPPPPPPPLLILESSFWSDMRSRYPLLQQRTDIALEVRGFGFL